MKTHMLDQMLESINELDNTNYYAFVGDHLSQGETAEEIADLVESLRKMKVEPFQNMVFGKKLVDGNMRLMIRRYNWTEGNVYEMYDDQTIDLKDTNYFVVVDESAFKHVYKCIYNNGGVPSTIKPRFSDAKFDEEFYEDGDGFYETSDGYVWKYMYTVDSTTFNQFATERYIPVTANNVVENIAINGSIDVVVVDYAGKNYNNWVNRQFAEIDVVSGNTVQYRLPSDASNVTGFYANTIIQLTSGTGSGEYKRVVNSYYDASLGGTFAEIESAFDTTPDSTTKYEMSPEVLVIGDGRQTANCFARAIIDSAQGNSVSRVEILDHGVDYNYTVARVLEGVPASAELTDVGELVVPDTASVRPILPPPGGHGANTIIELSAQAICVYADFQGTENSTISVDNGFAQFGVVRDPLYANVEINLTKFTTMDAGVDGSFINGENVHQFKKVKLSGTVSVNTGDLTVTSSDTNIDFDSFFSEGDYVFIEDTATNNAYRYVGTIDSFTNTDIFELTNAPTWQSDTANIYAVRITASAQVNDSGYNDKIYARLCEPNFEIGELIFGESSQAVANVASFDVDGRNTTAFDVFNQVTTLIGSVTTGTFLEDEIVYQGDVNEPTAAAYVHSANNTHLKLTNVEGNFLTNTAVTGVTSEAVFAGESEGALFTKYVGELEPTSGSIIYMQNDVPVTRNDQQTEKFRVILEL